MVVLSTLWLCRKELQVFCFDSNFASSTGWCVLLLDLILLTSVLVVVIVGANVVGVILVVALMVIPPVSARFWTSQLQRTVCISAFLGGMAGVLGSIASLYIDHMPTGPSIVLAAALLFSISLLFGKEKGLVWRAWSFSTLKNEADSEHVLRSIFEVLESLGQQPQPHGQTRSEGIAPSTLIRTRSWDGIRLKRAIDSICREGWAVRNSSGEIALTASGIQASLKSVRRHRLLELYFANLADLSPAALDRGADVLEHALDDEMLAKLEQDFISMGIKIDVPESVHPILSN
jgi:manganese/zinc/iron transport system permease protein